MNKIRLLLGLHSHQPVGNFDFVFDEAYQKSYLPFLEVAKQYPEFKFTLHFTGALWEYFEEKHPEFFDLIADMLAKEQIELVISGFYEPVLAAIPERDRILQIKKSLNYIRKKFGERPVGLWLTERVYEGDVLKTLVDLNLGYVVVDDYHFLQAGISERNLFGYYYTEHEGKKIAVFPINQQLRYLIPFKTPAEIMDYLEQIAEDTSKDAACIFDDGEKFGVWPGTYDWVYKKGWLRDFIEKILSSQFVITQTYREYLKEHKPLGRVYLPSSSYFEMGEWSLPSNVAVRFEEFIDKLGRENILEDNRMFIKGGIWKNFLVKYSESNTMHKKMILVSNRVSDFNGHRKNDAVRYLLRSQANDAYWHGVFGGLYLPHLRRAVYENLLKAESIVTKNLYVRKDINTDGFDELYMQNGRIGVGVSAKDGGIYELSFMKKAVNFQDTLTRRFEHYHRFIEVKEEGGSDESALSIHEIKRYVNKEVKQEMVYDWYERKSFLFHIIPEDTHVEDMRYMNFREYGDFVNMPYSLRGKKGEFFVALHRRGGIYRKYENSAFEITKELLLDNSALYMKVRSSGRDTDGLLAALEFNLHFVKPVFLVNDRIVEGNDKMFEEEGNGIIVEDRFFNAKLDFICTSGCKVWVYPVYTLSQSESGMDMVYQGTSVLFVYPLKKRNFNLTLKMEEKYA